MALRNAFKAIAQLLSSAFKASNDHAKVKMRERRRRYDEDEAKQLRELQQKKKSS